MLSLALGEQVYAIGLLFARIGAALMVMPVFAEVYVTSRHRLLLAILLSALIGTADRGIVPPQPAEPAVLAALVAHEIVLGLFIGTLARLLHAVVHLTGEIMAMSSGFAVASFFDPNQGASGSALGSLLMMSVLVLVVAADGHHLMLRGLADSYASMPILVFDQGPVRAELLMRMVNEAMATALRISAPLVLAGFLFNLALGLLNRLMPSFQAFFVAVPLQLLLAFSLLALVLGTALVTLLGFLDTTLTAQGL